MARLAHAPRPGNAADGGNSLYFPRSASLRPPTAFWILPFILSALPSASSLRSPTALPRVSLTEPLICLADPAMRSLSMTTSSGLRRILRLGLKQSQDCCPDG